MSRNAVTHLSLPLVSQQEITQPIHDSRYPSATLYYLPTSQKHCDEMFPENLQFHGWRMLEKRSKVLPPQYL